MNQRPAERHPLDVASAQTADRGLSLGGNLQPIEPGRHRLVDVGQSVEPSRELEVLDRGKIGVELRFVAEIADQSPSGFGGAGVGTGHPGGPSMRP